ncbi:fimbrial protein [Pseudomonas aeruginosa]|uniref:fimbrial protein n=1 Tax=Pseudomonas aeruginosa TaxID=287 RepID=UPI0009FA4D49|nr:fimbrial protein [Pseudomonas aeruginosa]MCC0192578.1 type 1 fimbrial protein [Pseudomonas aeruginosa]MCC0226580.1 type 1 fimbrial protein [Pseudomonas aeruginosa]MCC0450659.1 type 1 fimbrial protein [Pseudomonas aeruginosa]MDI3755857.1 fimbrial protein [Pseudomonas aeruginosa]MDI3999463.1 fimbrial protein [Pseudomonas aeruginosa]
MSTKVDISPTLKICAASLYTTLSAFLPQEASATCQWIQGSSSILLTSPTTLTASSESENPSPISDWIENSYPSLWKCNSTLNLNQVGVTTSSLSASSGQMYDGLTIYKTSTPGVGYVAKAKIFSTRGSDSAWGDLSSNEAGLFYDSPSTLGIGLSLRLIKIGPILPGTQIKRIEILKGTSYVKDISGNSKPDLITRMSLGPINVIVPTCQTRNIDVPLGEVSTSKFKGIGSEAGSRDFAITLENCPGGFNKITYRLDPVSEVIDASKGIIQLEKISGNASGIAIRIQGRGSALKFGTEQELSSYKGSKGNYDIPLSASYYQTGPITPGTANTSLEFKISYQ